VDGAFAENGLIYISYLQGDENASVMRVLKARFDEDSEALVEQQDIFESTPGPRPELIGGRIALSGDGYLFLSLGDRWDPPRAQDLSDDAGSVIRIRTDGSIPDDNPFRFTLGARPEIWSYGHRNPQGLAYDPARGELWSHEHGPQGGDEVNLVLPGHNYGWPISTFGVDYSGRPIAYGIEPEGLEPPIHYWVPISVAPSGLALETDGPNLVLWIGTLAGQMLIELTTSEHCVLDEQHFLKGAVGRIRDVRIDPNGDLFVLTDGSEGMLYRIDRTPLEMGANSKAHL
jgi:glucose/arabinose dehydrogenase